MSNSDFLQLQGYFGTACEKGKLTVKHDFTSVTPFHDVWQNLGAWTRTCNICAFCVLPVWLEGDLVIARHLT